MNITKDMLLIGWNKKNPTNKKKEPDKKIDNAAVREN